MKKRNKFKPHKDNIFLFPDLEQRLMEKGLESLKTKRYSEAVEYLEKAHELNNESDEITLGLIIAYFESSQLLKAKQLANDSLQKGVGDYFQIIDLYIMILLQLNEFQEIVSTIEVLIEEREIPGEKLDNFLRILDFSKRKLEVEQEDVVMTHSYEEEEEDLDLLQFNSLNEQFLAVANLSHKNVRAYLPGLKQYLQSSAGHPFIKTMILLLLKEQDVADQLFIEKLNQQHSVCPQQLPSMEDMKDSLEIKNIIKTELEQSNPILFENTLSIIDRHTFLLYPFHRGITDSVTWAAAYHFMTLEYYGEAIADDELIELYGIESANFKKALAYLRELEEISSPIL